MTASSTTKGAGRDAGRGAPGLRLGRAGLTQARNWNPQRGLRLPHHGGRAGVRACTPLCLRELASDGRFLLPEVDPFARGGRRVRAGRRTPFVGGPLCVARENLALTNCRQPASDAVREVTKRLPCVVALHPQRMEQRDGKLWVEDRSKVSGE